MPPTSIIIRSLSTTLLLHLLDLDSYIIVNNGSSWPDTITLSPINVLCTGTCKLACTGILLAVTSD